MGTDRQHVGIAVPTGFPGRRTTQAIAVVNGLAAALLSDAAPTGTTGWDAVLLAATATLVFFAVLRLPRWGVLIFATGAAMCIGLSLWTIPAGIGLAVAFAAAADERLARTAAVVCGCLSWQAFLHLPAYGFFGLPSVIAGCFMLFAFLAAYLQLSAWAKRVVRLVVAVVLMVVATLLAIGGLAAIEARAEANRGVAAVRDVVALGAEGDIEMVGLQLETASDAFETAHARLSSNWLRPLALVPVAAQNHRAVLQTVEQGALIAHDGAALTEGLDLGSFQGGDGSVNVDEIARLAPSLDRVVRRLESAQLAMGQADPGWVFSTITTARADLKTEVDDVLPAARLGADAAATLPGLLGADSQRRYFIAFGTPAESREFGGLLGSWAIMTADNGQVELVDSGRIDKLYELARSTTIDPAAVPDWYLESGRPTQWPQNLTGSPNIDVVAQSVRTMLEGADGIDGFVYVDAWAIIDILKITGPLKVSWRDDPLSADNAVRFFFRDQYESSNRNDTFGELTEVLEAALIELTTGDLPAPQEIGAVLGKTARGGHLQVATFDESENDFLRAVQLQRVFGWPAATADGLAVVQTNGSESKMDLYLERDVTYRVQHEADGQLDAALTVVLSSKVPDDAPQAALGLNGFNRVFLSAYSPHVLREVTLDGEPTQFWATSEFGYQRYQISVWLPPNSSYTAKFEFAGFADPLQPYDLAIWHQPLVNDDHMTMEYRGPAGSESAESLTLRENYVFSPTSDG